MKKVVVFGAGRIAAPCVRHMLKDPDLQVVVVDKVIENAQKIIANHPGGEAVSLDLQDADNLIDEADLVVSLLPRFLDLQVINKCIEHKTSLVFPNFLSPEIKDLDQKAKEAGITVLGEIGLDPGIDHMSAVKVIDEIKEKGGAVKKFSSWCGGLPAPDAANEPVRYKFSWSPEEAIEACTCPARFQKQGKEINISGSELMKHYSFKNVAGCGWFEEYPNSDAIFYIDIYGIPEVDTIYRGTFRYPGWCETIACLYEVGMFDTRVEDVGNMTYKEYICKRIGLSSNENIARALAEYLGVREYSVVIKNIEWLGFFNNEPLPFEQAAAKEILSDLLLKKLSYGKGERDLVVMVHEFDVLQPGGKAGRITSTLVEYGEPDGDSAMARTTGLPVAIAAKIIVRGKYGKPGVQIPVDRELYRPVLKELEELGIYLKDTYVEL